jgi:hypothetical protein
MYTTTKHKAPLLKQGGAEGGGAEGGGRGEEVKENPKPTCRNASTVLFCLSLLASFRLFF